MSRLWGNKLLAILFLFLNFIYIFSNSLVGEIKKIGDVYFFVSDGKKYEIGVDRWLPAKYLNTKIELKDPIIIGNRIVFEKYRIYGSNTSYWEILSQKLKKIDFDFNVYLDKNYLYFSFIVMNRSLKPVKFKFPSSQEVDFVVMNRDLKNTIWRWSWGKKFKIGYVNEVLLPHQQLKYYARWNYVRSYVEDGEYKAFAEFHALPHGKISDVKAIIIKTVTKYFEMDEDLLPLSIGTVWRYESENEPSKVIEMKVTGTAFFNEKKYFVVQNFLDENYKKLMGNSRFIRFDPNKGNFFEYLDGKEVPLFKKRFKIVEDDKGGYDFLKFSGRKWILKYTFKKGIGIFSANLNGDKFILKNVNFSLVEDGNKNKNDFSCLNENLFFKESGGYQKKDIFYSIWGNGSLVVIDRGKIVFQCPIDREKFYLLLKKIKDSGFFELKSFYGKDSVYYPLTIKIELKGKENKSVTVKTSKSDKPPFTFWDVVDLIKCFVKNERKKYEK